MQIYLDFETFYDTKTYTLRNMSMEAYIRDSRYETQLLGIAIDNGPIHMLDRNQVLEVLPKLPLSHPDTWTFVQNAKFDVSIIEDRYGIHVANPICARAMARWTGISRLTRESQDALCKFLNTGVKSDFISNMSGKRCEDLTLQELKNYKDYCASDVRDLRANIKAMMPYMTEEALHFISMTTKMYTHPNFVLDRGLLESYYAKLVQAHEESRERLARLFRFGTQEEFLKALRSKAQFCEMLTSIGGIVPYKISEKKTATAKAKLEMQLAQYQELRETNTQPDHAIVNAMVALQEQLNKESYVVMEPALAKNDLDFMALMDDPNEDIAALATARAENNSSQAMSRTLTFLEIAKRGSLPVPLEPYQAWTGRYSGGSAIEDVKSDGVNLQNLAKRTGDKTLRNSVCAPEGYMVVAGDSAQVEARVGAWVANETQLVKAFADNQDPYIQLAAAIYNVMEEELYYWCKGEGFIHNLDAEKTKLAMFHRFIGKTGILQLQYGSGASKLATFLNQNKVMLEGNPDAHAIECKRIVDIYRNRYLNITAFWKVCNQIIKALYAGDSGYFGGPNDNVFYFDGNHQVFGRRVPGIMFPNGYWLRYPNLRQEVGKDGWSEWVYDQMTKGRIVKTRLYGPKLMNNLVQGLSFAALIWQGIRINTEYPIALNVHDEWVSVVPEAQADRCIEVYKYWLKQPPPWAVGIPFDCEVSKGKTYGEV